jgi:FtsH-binding integral membrane protein
VRVFLYHKKEVQSSKLQVYKKKRSGNYMNKLYTYIAISLLATVLGFFAGLLFIPAEIIALANMLLLAFLVVVMIIAFIVKIVKKKASRPIRFPIWVVYLYAFIQGALLYPAMIFYMQDLGMSLFLSIVIGTMVVFGVLAAIGQKSKDGAFAGLGPTLLVILGVMIAVSIVNLFLRVDMISLIISAVGVLLFSVYIMFDVNRFKTAYNDGLIQDSSDYSIHVLNVYLDIINLLLDILDLVRRIKN